VFHWFFVRIAQHTEQARPKRQVAGESPAEDTSLLVSFVQVRIVTTPTVPAKGKTKEELEALEKKRIPLADALNGIHDYRKSCFTNSPLFNPISMGRIQETS